MLETLRRMFGKQLAERSSPPASVRRLALEVLESRLTPSAYTDNQVVNLYRIFLDRVPEAPALAAWSGALETGRISVGQMADRILRSPEHAGRAVTGAYEEYLGRLPETGGLAAHAVALELGWSPERVDASILGSNEYFARQGSGNIAFVQGLYRDVLGRQADSVGLEAHVGRLARGASRTEVAYAFLTSGERGRQVAGDAYREVLGREGTEAELAGWAGVLKRSAGGSAAVWSGVAGSMEGTQNLTSPSTVQDLKVTPTGVGKLLLTWEAPAGGGATSYTVTINSGNDPVTNQTTSTRYAFSDLNTRVPYTFTVTASNASGTSWGTATVRFGSTGQLPISVGSSPQALTTGLDGSIWVANEDSNTVQQITQTGGVWTAQPAIGGFSDPKALTTGLDGSIWVANYSYKSNTVQQILQTGGVWTPQPAISVGTNPAALTTGLDGSIWVANYKANTVQQITLNDGIWTAQPAIRVGVQPSSLTRGHDGSIWVANYSDKSNTVQQIKKVDGAWTAQTPIDVGEWPKALTTGLDGSIWVANRGSNTVQQIKQINGVWTPQPTFGVANNPYTITTGHDGSIWVANYSKPKNLQQVTQAGGVWTEQAPISLDQGEGLTGSNAYAYCLITGLDGSIWFTEGSRVNSVQQRINPPNAPIALSAKSGPGSGEMTLTWHPPASDGGSPVAYYTVTAYQGATSQTILTSSTSVTFSGLESGEGDTYFTVTATNFVGVSKAACHQVDSEGKTIPELHTAIGISTDGVPISEGGFDGQGNTYSWEAMGNAAAGGSRIGNALVWNGFSFELGSPNQPSLTWAAGQELAVSGTGSRLNLAAAAAGGTSAGQTGQHLVLNFSDGSSTTWTQSFSDWLTPSGYAGEAVISTQSYRNTASGGQDTVANHVYGYNYAIPAGKTLESITLPYNPNLRILDWTLSDPVQVGAGYTGYGLVVGNNNVPNSGKDAQYGFDGNSNFYNVNSNGNALGVTISGPDSSYDYQQIAWNGATFDLGPAPNNAHTAKQTSGNNNVVQAKGQTIALPNGDYSALLMIGAGANGTQSNQEIRLTFSDGSTAIWTQTFTDWRNNNGSNNNPPPTPQQLAASGEALVAQTNVVNSLGNNQMKENAFVYGYAYQIPAGKTLTSITLPDNSNVGILGVAMV